MFVDMKQGSKTVHVSPLTNRNVLDNLLVYLVDPFQQPWDMLNILKSQLGKLYLE